MLSERTLSGDMAAIPAFAAYLFDLDGTVYLGEQAIPGVPEALARLQARGAKIAFITNNPLLPPEAYAAKLSRLGIPTAPEQVITSANVLGDYVAEHYAGAKMLLLGEEVVRQELQRAGALLVADWREAEVLVVSWDRSFTYEKLNWGLQALRQGVIYLATNPDVMCPVGPDEFVPDCGAILAAFKAMTGREPDYIAGKPEPRLPWGALQRLGVSAEQAALVGDRLYTDIVCGRRAGLTTIAVLTGEATPEAIASASNEAKPHYVLQSAALLQ